MARQMTQNTLNALRGWGEYALEFTAPIAPSVITSVGVVLAGTVMHNTSTGLQLGVGTASVMPVFLFGNSDDPDAGWDGGDPTTTVGAYAQSGPTSNGNRVTLVASGSFEIASTQFVTDTYATNDPLTSDATGANAGKLKKGVIGTDMIVGFVSSGIVDNGYGHDALAFWSFPVFPG